MNRLALTLACAGFLACGGGSGSGGGGGGTGGSGGASNGGGTAQVLVDANTSSITFLPANPVVGPMAPTTVTVTARDSASRPLSGVPVTLSMSGTGNTIPLLAQTSASGETSTMVWSTKAETKTLSANVNGVLLTAQPALTFAAGPIGGFAFVVQPTATKAGAFITPAPQLEFRDAYDNPSNQGPFGVSVRLTFNSSNGVLSGATNIVPLDGGLLFPMLSVDQPQPGYALRAETDAGGATESARFDVTP